MKAVTGVKCWTAALQVHWTVLKLDSRIIVESLSKQIKYK